MWRFENKNEQLASLENQETMNKWRQEINDLTTENEKLSSTLEKFTNGKTTLILKGARRSGKKKHGLGYTPPDNEETVVYPKTYPTPKFVPKQDSI